jgi:FHS family L-fucose permease-like MFS transporter
MNSFASSVIGKELANVDPKAIVGAFVFLYWSGAMVGRFVGAYLTRIIKPGKVLAIFASLAITMLLVSISTTGLVAMWTILAVGLFNSIMFPTIFTLTIEGQGDLKPQASGLLCTAIVGGAIIPPLYGLLSDNIGFKVAFFLVVACYAYILFFGYVKSKQKVFVSS